MASENTMINGVVIPKGMLIGIPVYALHTDPENWPQPERFDPDRCSLYNIVFMSAVARDR